MRAFFAQRKNKILIIIRYPFYINHYLRQRLVLITALG